MDRCVSSTGKSFWPVTTLGGVTGVLLSMPVNKFGHLLRNSVAENPWEDFEGVSG
jgi:hypothetical protein